MDACFPLQDMDTIYYYSAFPGLTRYYTKMDILIYLGILPCYAVFALPNIYFTSPQFWFSCIMMFILSQLIRYPFCI